MTNGGTGEPNAIRDRSKDGYGGVVNASTMVADHPADRVAIVDVTRDERITYGELDDRIARSARLFRDLDVDAGDRVALCFHNEPAFLVHLFGLLRIGAVAVPINVETDRTRLKHVLADAGASIVVVGGGNALGRTVMPVIGDCEDVETVAVTDGREGVSVDDTTIVSIPTQLEDARAVRDATRTRASDPAIQPYTSGSTGRPKGVVLTHGGIDWCTDAFVRHCSLDASDRGLVVTPLYHKNAMTGVVKPMFAVGGTVVLLDAFDADRSLEAISTYDVTYVTGVPAVYHRLVEAADEDGVDYPSLEWASCGSQLVPTALRSRFESTFDAPLLEVYGLTEGGPMVTHSPRPGPQKPGSSGTPLPGVETMVVDPETGEELPEGSVGELLVSSPGVARYANRPTATAEVFVERDGKRFLRTGDRAYIDEAGYHFIAGRLDDMLIVGGENVYPATVEERLREHEAVDDVAVVGVPHAEKGEAPVAFVVGEGVTEEALTAYALAAGPAIEHPRRVFFPDRLPLTGTGKVDTASLRETARRRIGGPL